MRHVACIEQTEIHAEAEWVNDRKIMN